MNPVQGLIKSRKVAVGVVDGIAATIIIGATMLLSPEHLEVVVKLVAIWQPVVISIIVGIAYEDGQQKRGGGYPGPQGG